MLKHLMISAFLVLETAAASLSLVRIAPYILVLATVTVALLVISGKFVEEKHYPIYLYALALSAVWQTSMLGTHIVGIDVHTEMGTVNYAIAHGWNPALSDSNNTSILLGVIAPKLSHIISPTWQFKALYPAIFATVPVSLFFAYKHLIGVKQAFFASLFIMSMPMFTMETPSMVKGLVAQAFLALVVLFLFYPFKVRAKVIGLVVSLAGVSVTHYTVGFVAMALVLCVFGLKVVVSLFKSKRVGMSWAVSGSAVLAIIIALFTYYSLVGEGGMLVTVKNTIGNVIHASVAVAHKDDITSSTPSTGTVPQSTIVPTTTTTDALVEGMLKRTGGTSDSYLQNQEPLVKTALGLDFFSASIYGKSFRVLQFLVEAMILFGVFVIVFKRKLLFEYKASVLSCLALMLGCVFVPFLSISVSATRFYSLALFFLAPALIIACESLWQRQSS